MTTDTTVNKQRTINATGFKVLFAPSLGFWSVISSLLMHAPIDTSVDFATVQNSLHFNNAYFCCWNQNIWGPGQHLGGGPVPPRPQRHLGERQ